ncbi:MAG: radical SAM protein [Myxococcota bacterium]
MSSRRRALFVNPPLFVGTDFIDYPYFADYGLLVSAAWTARAGWAVDVVDAFARPGSGKHPHGDHFLLGVPNDAMLEAMPEEPVDVVAVASTPFLKPQDPRPETRELIAALRERYPDAALILADCHFGGMHTVEVDLEDVLAAMPDLDAHLRYAGDAWFSEPERLLDLKGTKQAVDAAAHPWRSSHSPPFPLLDALDREHHRRFLASCFADGSWSNPFDVTPDTLPFMTSGGCVHRCIFCTSNPGWQTVGRKPYRAVPLECIEQWAYLLVKGLGARKLMILDEIANLRPDFEEVLEVLEKLDLRYDFPNGVRADYLADSAIERMKGRVNRLSVSVESGDAAELSGPIAKRLDPNEVERVARTAHRVGVPLMVHYIIGFPWETPRQVLDTLEFAWRLHEQYGAEPAVQYATPLRGTPLHEMCLEQGLTTKQGADSTDPALFQHEPSYVPPNIPPGWLETAKGALEAKLKAARERKVIMNITYSCDNNCEFCATGDRVRKIIPWPRVERILREHWDQGIGQLDIDGGEPTLHPNLVDAIRLATDLGYHRINITSNGRRLADPERARELVQSGLTSLLISMHGHTPELHDRIVRKRGAFDQTVAGIRNALAYMSEDVDFGVNITIVRNNVDHLEEFTQLAWDLGARKVNYQMLTPFGNAETRYTDEDIVPPEREVAARLCEVIERWSDRLRIFVVNAQPCLFPGYERYVLPDLQKLGRTMVFVWDEEVNLFEYLGARRERVEICESCPHSINCQGFFDFESDYEPPREVRDFLGGARA